MFLTRDQNYGFTFVETLMVIAIIGIISAISLPVYQQAGPTLSLNAATRDLASDLRYAEQLAVTEQNVYQIILNTTANSYRLVNKNTGITIKTKDINHNISIMAISDLTDDTVSFTATGAATESGQITLKNSYQKTATIQIKPSGYVEIK